MDYLEIAKEILFEYGIEGSTLKLIRHNENMVWKVDALEGDSYVLRIHIPAKGLDIRHNTEWIESEMLILSDFSNNSEINVQRPIKSNSGKYVVELLDGTFATLLSWLPGDTFKDLKDITIADAMLVGQLVAKMHQHVLNSSEISNIKRPKYDSKRVIDSINSIEDGIEMGLFTEEMYKVLYDGAMCICNKMDYENSREGWNGLIHSDLGLSNMIIQDGIVSPIDFSLCGFGPFLFDIGGLMGTFDDKHLRKAVIEGYSKHRPLNKDDYFSIEAFFISSIYFFMSMHLHNTKVHEWFHRRVPAIISEYINPLINGKLFLDLLNND